MITRRVNRADQTWTVAALRLLSRDQRDAILAAAAASAEDLYRSDPDLTALEAFGEHELYGYSANDTTLRRGES